MQPGSATENLLNRIHTVTVDAMPVAACAKKAEISTKRTGSSVYTVNFQINKRIKFELKTRMRNGKVRPSLKMSMEGNHNL